MAGHRGSGSALSGYGRTDPRGAAVGVPLSVVLLGPRWRKVLRDLWGHKTRSALVVLSIAVGVFAVGMIAGMYAILPRELNRSYAAIHPAHAVLYTTPFDDELVQTVRRMPDVRDAEGRRSVTLRLRVGPERWRRLRLVAIADYNDMRIDKVWPEKGAWPPPKHAMLVERASLKLTGAHIGDTVWVETPNGRLRPLRIAGLAHDLNRPPAVFAGRVYGYVTFDTLEWLGLPRSYDELHIRVAGDVRSEGDIRRIAERVRTKVEKSGRKVSWVEVRKPGKHPADQFIPPLMALLGALGFLSLLASGFLVVNTLAALLTQQVQQIGVMKAIGARARQVAGLYLSMAFVFGLLALMVGVPLGILGARVFSAYMAHLINFDLTNFRIPPYVFALEAAVGLVIPLLAALYPVIAGARVTVREALSSHGLGNGRFGTGFIDRLLVAGFAPDSQPNPHLLRSHGRKRTRMVSSLFFLSVSFPIRGINPRWLSRPLLLSLRNTVRRKGRLALTLATLTLSGAIFIAVFSVRASLIRTLDDALDYWRYDVEVDFSRPYRIAQIEREALRVPGVVRAESWGFGSARRRRPDGSESDAIFIVAPPATTELLRPMVIRGRWLLPEDENALVVNTELLKDEPDIDVGDEIVLKLRGRETTWRVVGIVRGVMTGPIAYANYPYFARVVRYVGRAGGVQVVTTRHDAAFQAQVAKALEKHFEGAGLRVRSTQTIADIRTRVIRQFDILIVFLLVMAVLLALVGGLGLMGTMSINVLERTREIGVMRAIGASDGAVRRIVMTEGLIIGGLSWFMGSVLAWPISRVLSGIVGMQFMQAPLSYRFSVGGALLWLGIALVLAALASFLPARSASRLSVREVLAYE